MSKNIVILLGSTRKNGNTELLTNEFMRGAAESGNHVDKILLRELNINHCIGCGACQKNDGHCFRKDDMQQIYDAMLQADVIVFASPVYFYSWTTLIKSVIDRTFAIEKSLTHKKFYLISVGAALEEKYMQTMLDFYHQYIGCFRCDGNEDGDYIIGYETNMPGDIKDSPAMAQAYKI